MSESFTFKKGGEEITVTLKKGSNVVWKESGSNVLNTNIVDLINALTVTDQGSGVVQIDVESSGIKTDELDLSITPTWTGQHTFNGGVLMGGALVKNRISSKTSNYTTVVGDYLIPVDTSGGAVTITLGSAQVNDGQELYIKDEGGSAGSNNITIDTEGSENIDGVNSKTISTNYEKLRFYSDGSNWFTI